MEVTAGPDSFLALSDTFDYAANVILTEHLRERQAAGNVALERALPRLRRELSKSELVGLIRAIHRRIAWIDQQCGELSDPRRWQEFLAQPAHNLYSPNLPVAAEDLIALLEGHRKYPVLWTFGPEELLVAFVETNDLTLELAAELRLFQAELKGQPGSMKYQSQAGYQVAVQHVHMLLWHDGNDPLDRSRCWSEIVRGDLRAMVGERQTRWKSLLRHIKGNAPAKPPKAWLKGAEKRLIAVGQEEFIHELEAWFAPFRSDTPQPMSVAGSHVLRGILWYASLVDDPAVMPVALSVLNAKWRAKRNVEKVMVALVPVLGQMPPELRWPPLLELQQEWGTASGQIEELLKTTGAELGVSENDLQRQMLLKPTLDFGHQLGKLMDRLARRR
jgi:hypothetical protein